MDKVSKLETTTLSLGTKTRAKILPTTGEATGDMKTVLKEKDKNGNMKKFPTTKLPSSPILANTDHAMVTRSIVAQTGSNGGRNSNSTKLALALELDCLKETNALPSKQTTDGMLVGSLLIQVNGFGVTEVQLTQEPNGVAGTLALMVSGL